MSLFSRSGMVTGALILGLASYAQGKVVATIVDDDGDPHSVNVAPGQTFNVRVELSADAPTSLTAAEFKLTELSSTGAFKIVSLEYDQDAWEGSQGLGLPATTQDMAGPGFKSARLGTIAQNLHSGAAAGSVAMLAISVHPAAQDGLYSLNLSDLSVGDTAFKALEDAAAGQTYQVQVGIGAPIGLSLKSAASRRTHGDSGTLDLALPLNGGTEVEARKDGTAPQMVLTFSGAIEAADGTADCSEVVITNGTCNKVAISGNQMIVDMSFKNNACVRVGVDGIRAVADGSPLQGKADVEVRVIQGDANGDGVVNLLDLQAMKNSLARPVAADIAQYDCDCSGGQINILDLQCAKDNLQQRATCP